MRVFVTGATEFVGSAIVRELLDAGHQVLGLVPSDEAAASLAAAGAQARRGTAEDVSGLRAGVAASDGVIYYTAYIHDVSDIEKDQHAIRVLGEALARTGRPFVITAGIDLSPGHLTTEEDMTVPCTPREFRILCEQAGLPFAGRDVRASAVRLPPVVHGEGDPGIIPNLISIARKAGFSAYVGDGAHRWPAVHRLDAAHLFRLALEEAPAGARLHAIGDEGVPFRDIAGAIGRHLDVPVTAISAEDADGHFGSLGPLVSLDSPASSALTQDQMGWHPTQPGLIPDLGAGHYFQ